ncbi:MAG: SusD/RagB family nutrient-binding outer membrane lipoprotein [Arcicella sp.]|nr:SusD/RagB family nutrient-binding outer membrane lipoprotein [Arcicella sp.]
MKKIKILLLTFTVMSLSSCKDYLDINQDPANPQVAEGYVLLPPIMQSMVRGEAFDSRYVGQYIQNWALSGGGNQWDRHGYVAGSDAAGEKWRQHYFALGKNLDIIIKDGTETQKWDYVGVALAIKAWSWQSTTDYHGEMILKQIFEPNRYVFDYDGQDEIYAEVQKECNDALAALNRTDGNSSTASLLRGDAFSSYKGDKNKWIKFVYAILARNAHHISNKASYDPNKVIEYVDKSLASNADNLNVIHNASSSTDANFFGALRNNMANYRQTIFALSLVDGTVFDKNIDPRLPFMFTPSPDGVYRGVFPGSGDPNNVAGNARRIPTIWGIQPASIPSSITKGKYVFQDAADYPIITYSELQFIKAEAALKKGDQAMALDAFNKGVNASMDFVNSYVPAADRATFATNRTRYLASTAIPKTAATLKLSDIMLQKYISMYGHGALETWVDLRRHKYSPDVYTGFSLPTAFFPDNNDKPVQRVRPRFNSEYVWNRSSLEKLGGNNPDYHTYEMWFTKP